MRAWVNLARAPCIGYLAPAPAVSGGARQCERTMALRLNIPTVEEHPDPEAELRPVYLEEWIEGLPYADLGVLTRTVLDALVRLNRSPVKPGVRFMLLEQFLRHPTSPA